MALPTFSIRPAREVCAEAQAVAPSLAAVSAALRSQIIARAAELIRTHTAVIIEANERDLARGRERAMPEPLIDRLLLNEERLEGIAAALDEVASQADPLGRVVDGCTLECGVRIERLTVPLGVVAVVYEARPNVTADAFALCVRSGNACVLKGGSAARNSCETLAALCRQALIDCGLSGELLQYVVDDAERTQSLQLVQATGLVDALVPRGGALLIRFCIENATVPTIETGTGNCHIYLHKEADLTKALPIVLNAKTSRPGVCNAAESLLVDRSAAERLLPPVLEALVQAGVTLVGDEDACAIAAARQIAMDGATEEDFGREFLDLRMSVACVEDVHAAVAHINRFGTGHSEAIVSESYAACEAFLAGVDAAAVYANASTRFTDGGVFGLGGEIGISTQKLHARGPMGAGALTTTKYVCRGEGQIR